MIKWAASNKQQATGNRQASQEGRKDVGAKGRREKQWTGGGLKDSASLKG
ncbi:MAG: hypothetical protein LBL13_02410 [Bacteroidales bacterium]|nr:hypothetical protein [Bacteroidales bacterium]